MSLDKSPTISEYKEKLKQLAQLYYGNNISNEELNKVLDYSVNKRIKNTNVSIDNSYTKRKINSTLLKVSDYIKQREPIVTAYGTMFKHHGEVPNPLFDTVQEFLDLRGIHKKEMFKHPKGSEEFEKFNLAQTLDKIDSNGKQLNARYKKEFLYAHWKKLLENA